MVTAYLTHPRFVEHHFEGHPEHAGRIQAVWRSLEAAGLISRMKQIEPTPVDDETIKTVHTDSYVETLNWMVTQDKVIQFDSDTYAYPESAEVARLSAGAVVGAVEAVMSNVADNALAAVRPPGHHALDSRGMGFCLLSNVAIAARYAQQKYGINRVMIVDYDVHHGNGTQDAFYDDESVLFISSHQSPFYPGTGKIHETGTDNAKGTTINIPLRAGMGDPTVQLLYKEIVWKAARRFKPELIIVSAGFDAHWKDPLAMIRLSLEGYAFITEELIRMAEELCNGKIVFAMEGGYDLGVLANGIRNVAHALLGDLDLSDPFGGAQEISQNPNLLVDQLCEIHNL